MTNVDIAHQRLFNQHISQAVWQKPEEVVAWLGAAQAQDYAGAKWAIGLRLPAAVDADIEQAFNDGKILRTHLLRPTWHFVTPADIRWLLTLTAPRVHAINGTMYRQLELTSAIFKQCHSVLVKALQNGQHLTREELQIALQQAGVVTDGSLRLGYIMMQAELNGIVCSGPRKGKQFTYMLLDERAPQARMLAHEEALAELAQRYFMSRGPATVQDFAKWSGLTVADARRGLEDVKVHFEHEILEDHTYWFPTAASFAKIDSPTAYLLSIYDEYISSYKDRSAIGEASHGPKLMALGNALSYIMIVDGQIVGTWKRRIKKQTVVIETNFFTALAEAEHRAIARAGQAYGDFLGLSVEWV